MSLYEAEEILRQCSPDMLRNAISIVFRRLLGNLLLEPENTKFQRVRRENALIRNILGSLPDAVVATLFGTMGFELESAPDSEAIYVFKGNAQTLQEADQLYSNLEHRLQEIASMNTYFHLPPLEARREHEMQHRREEVLQHLRRDASMRSEAEGAPTGEKDLSQTVFNPVDFSSVDHLIDIARRTLLNTGRVRNCLFEGRHFSLRRMLHGRVYACKEGCTEEFLEAHWHLFTGKNILYSYIAHLSPDASTTVHMGVEHGFQYNSLPGSKHFRKTVHFSSKRTNETNGLLEQLDHPNTPSETCVYCGVPFSQLFA